MSSAPAEKIDTQFDALISTFAILCCFLTGSVQCLLRGDSHSLFARRRLSQDPPRNVLFAGARLLISDFSDPALCPSKFSSEILSRDGQRHWPSSVCLSLLDPWSRVVQLHRPAHDGFFRRPQPIVRTQLDRPSASLQSSSGMLHCELVVAPGQFSSICIQGIHH